MSRALSGVNIGLGRTVTGYLVQEGMIHDGQSGGVVSEFDL